MAANAAIIMLKKYDGISIRKELIYSLDPQFILKK